MPRRALLIAAAVAITPTGAIAATRAADGSSSAQTPASQTLSLVAKPTSGGQVDNRPKGTSPGDEFYEHGTITDRAGHHLGTFALTTQLVAGTANHGTEQSTVDVFLRDGQLVTTGGHATVARFSMAVVGGTGRYSGARGTVNIAPGPHNSEHANVQLQG